MHKVLPVVLMLLCTGCTLAPKYEQPAAPVAQTFPSGPAYEEVAFTQEAIPEWQDFFVNEKVKKAIELGLANNRDFRVAALNVEKAKAAYGIQRAPLFPSVAGGLTENASRTPGTLSNTGTSVVQHTYQANLATSSWELDFFGRIRSLSEAALQQYFATEEAKYAAQVALIGEIASAWLNLGTQKELLRLAEVTLKSQEESFKLMQASYRLGAASELDLEQARTTVESAKASKAMYQRTLAQARNALDLLLGTSLPAGLEPQGIEVVTTQAAIVPAGLPSTILLQRPDIRQAENQLKAANANIGAARANFFPRISLTAGVGTGSRDLGDLFDGGTGLWSFVPSISLPIFTGGANLATLRQAEADEKIMVAQYEKAIQTAFAEVADAMAAKGTVTRQTEALKRLMNATTRAYNLSMSRYKNGLDGFLTVLESQRQMVQSQTNYIQSEQQRINALIQLYKVLGGGAPKFEDESMPKEQVAMGGEG